MKHLTILILIGAISSFCVAEVAHAYHKDLEMPMKMKRGAKDHPNTELPSDANFREGKQKYDDGDYDGAIDAFLQSVYFARNEYAPVANFWLGKSYMAKWKDRSHNEDGKAIEAFKKSVEQTLGGSPDTHLLMGETLLRDGSVEAAEQECYKSISETEGFAYKAHNLMGLICEAKDDYGSAEGHFVDALGDPPYTYTEAWMNLAECQMHEKNWGAAMGQFKKMLVSPKKLIGINYPKVYLDMGICLVAKGDHQGAIDNWHTSLDFNKDNPEPHLQLGMLYDAENHIQSAIKEYKEFIRTSSDTMKVDKAKERVTMLEQKVAPPEAEPEQARPSPYMRHEVEQQQKQLEQKQQQMQNRDSGF